jgi:predicted DNA-binding transcriptional regulator AlpA
MDDKVFNELPMLIAVPRAAELLGISRASAYRLASTGELPVRRLARIFRGFSPGAVCK